MNSEDNNLLWIDLEMTGLDESKDQIIEIAVIITDSQLNISKEGPCVPIQCNEHLLATMDTWCQNIHS